jgi:hypothetical protein
MQHSTQLLVLLAMLSPAAATLDTSGFESRNPIKKVVNMLKEMQATVEKRVKTTRKLMKSTIAGASPTTKRRRLRSKLLRRKSVT